MRTVIGKWVAWAIAALARVVVRYRAQIRAALVFVIEILKRLLSLLG